MRIKRVMRGRRSRRGRAESEAELSVGEVGWRGGRVARVTSFNDPGLFATFGLPQAAPARSRGIAHPPFVGL
jgi:hypothetical protein